LLHCRKFTRETDKPGRKYFSALAVATLQLDQAPRNVCHLVVRESLLSDMNLMLAMDNRSCPNNSETIIYFRAELDKKHSVEGTNRKQL